MNAFRIWFPTGIEHILNFSSFDHILFVTLLSINYYFNEWRKLLLLISAFTVGHSISLALSISDHFQLPQSVIEFGIALSILLAAIYQLIAIKKTETKTSIFLLVVVACFGSIHGLGFSYQLKSLLGKEDSFLLPLFYFNLGIELGQLIIVLIVLVFSLLLAFVLKCPFKIYKLIITCTILLISLKITAERFLELF